MPSPSGERNQFMQDVRLVLHFTNNWMLYGGYGFVMFCAAVAAVRGVAGV